MNFSNQSFFMCDYFAFWNNLNKSILDPGVSNSSLQKNRSDKNIRIIPFWDLPISDCIRIWPYLGPSKTPGSCSIQIRHSAAGLKAVNPGTQYKLLCQLESRAEFPTFYPISADLNICTISYKFRPNLPSLSLFSLEF